MSDLASALIDILHLCGTNGASSLRLVSCFPVSVPLSIEILHLETTATTTSAVVAGICPVYIKLGVMRTSLSPYIVSISRSSQPDMLAPHVLVNATSVFLVTTPCALIIIRLCILFS